MIFPAKIVINTFDYTMFFVQQVSVQATLFVETGSWESFQDQNIYYIILF